MSNLALPYNCITAVYASCRQWHDNTNGNTYFSVRTRVLFESETEHMLTCSFQYGYGTHWHHVACATLCQYLGLEYSGQSLIDFRDDNPSIEFQMQCHNVSEEVARSWGAAL